LLSSFKQTVGRIWVGPVLKQDCQHKSNVDGSLLTPGKDDKAVEKLIREIAHRVIFSLNELEENTDFETLTNLTDPELRYEAVLLQEEINKLRTTLQNI
jgi:hypothetical protein